MYTALKAINFIGLVLLVGGPVFFAWVWKGDPARVRLSSQKLLWCGALLFALSSIADILRIAFDVVPHVDMFSLWMLLTQTTVGINTLYKLGLIALWLLIWTRPPRPKLLASGAVLVALGILYTVSRTSHAGGAGGVTPIVADMVHLLAACVWGGGLLALALLPWRDLSARCEGTIVPVAQATRRFSNLAAVSITLLGLTGIYAASLHMYGIPALTGTMYGRSLIFKLGIVAAALGFAAANHFYFLPALARSAHARGASREHRSRLMRSFARSVRVEAFLVVALLAATASLTVKPPPNEPVAVYAPVSQRVVAGSVISDVRVISDPQGSFLFTVRLHEEGRPVSDARIVVHLEMVDHPMGIRTIQAQHVRDGLYRAEGALDMSGLWRAEATIEMDGGPLLRAGVEFDAVSVASDPDFVRHISLQQLRAASAGERQWFWASAGLTLALFAALVYGIRKQAWHWMLPVASWAIALLVASALPVVTVEGYPTTFLRSQVAYGSDSIAAGRELFLAHCAVCHGAGGRGDGAALAGAESGAGPGRADLAAEHVEEHSDGDLFWWISSGIRGTMMPGFESSLTTDQRWHVINFVRSLRRDPPDIDPGV